MRTTFREVKKALVLLMVVCFLVSATIATASAKEVKITKPVTQMTVSIAFSITFSERISITIV